MSSREGPRSGRPQGATTGAVHVLRDLGRCAWPSEDPHLVDQPAEELAEDPVAADPHGPVAAASGPAAGSLLIWVPST